MMTCLNKKLLKFTSAVITIFLFGWGISSVAIDDIQSASANFSVIGIVSDISDSEIEINEAQGSDKSGRTSYDLNIENIENVQTDNYVPLSIQDIKIGDKVIAQGLTNGSTFFIKRLISFSADISDIATTTIDLVIASSTATSTEEVAVSEEAIDEATASAPEIASSSATTTPSETAGESVDDETSTSSAATTTDEEGEASSTDSNSTSTESIVDTVIGVVGDIVDEVVETIIDVFTGNDEDTASPPLETPPVETPIIIIETPIDNTNDINIE